MDTETQGRKVAADSGANGSEHLVAGKGSEEDKFLKQAETDMLYRLKSSIDSRGRYSYRLGDMAAGYAAGRGMSSTVAKISIERKFKDEFGQTPQEYLDRHYDEMRANGYGKLRSSSSEEEKERSKGSRSRR